MLSGVGDAPNGASATPVSVWDSEVRWWRWALMSSACGTSESARFGCERSLSEWVARAGVGGAHRSEGCADSGASDSSERRELQCAGWDSEVRIATDVGVVACTGVGGAHWSQWCAERGSSDFGALLGLGGPGRRQPTMRSSRAVAAVRAAVGSAASTADDRRTRAAQAASTSTPGDHITAERAGRAAQCECLGVHLGEQGAGRGAGAQVGDDDVGTTELGEVGQRWRGGDDLPALVGGRPLGGQRGDRRVDRLAQLDERSHRVRGGFGAEVEVGESLGDDRAIASPLDEPGDHQALDGLAHGRAGDAELLAQRPLRRQRRPRREVADGDRLGQPQADLRRDRVARDGIERWTDGQTIPRSRHASAI